MSEETNLDTARTTHFLKPLKQRKSVIITIISSVSIAEHRSLPVVSIHYTLRCLGPHTRYDTKFRTFSYFVHYKCAIKKLFSYDVTHLYENRLKLSVSRST